MHRPPPPTRDARRRRRAAPHLAGCRAAVWALALVSTLVGAPPVQAARRQGSPPPEPAADGSARTRVPRVTGPVDVDGRLDEPLWRQAAQVPLDVEIEPGENVAPPVETVCLVAYDRDHLYVAFRASDPRPEEIRAHLTDRDKAFDDDYVGVILDTFDDRRRAYELFVNPLGVEMDLTRDALAGGEEDAAWDAIWSAAGRITADGYVVEMSVPFSSLRFHGGPGDKVWGFWPFRVYPRSVRHQITDFALDRNESCALCQVHEVVGFADATPGRNLEVDPTLTGGRTDTREDFPTGPLVSGGADVQAGVTASWGVTPDVDLEGTINPDFSQVEADVAQLDVNQQFALFFPERRPFFLEGADFFNTPFDAVFTRTIADPSWGAKVTGKAGGAAFGAIVARDAVTNLLLPGDQGSDTATLEQETTDTVLRYRRDVGSSSALGALVTDREGSGYSNRVAGLDGLVRFDERSRLEFQALGSRTRYPEERLADLGQPAGELQDTALQGVYRYSARNWSGHARYTDLGPDFRADLGFLPKVGFRRWSGGLDHHWIGDPEKDWYTSINLGGDYGVSRDAVGDLLERGGGLDLHVQGPLQSVAFAGLRREEQVFRGASFDLATEELFLTVRPSGAVGLSLDAEAGDAVDFDNVRPGRQLSLSPTVDLALGRHVRLELRDDYRRLDVRGGRLFTANLSQLRAVYQLNVRTFVRAIVEYTDVRRDLALYDRPEDFEARPRELFTQLLFSYKLDPRTVLFAGYSDTRDGDTAVGLTPASRSLFVKLGYAWVG